MCALKAHHVSGVWVDSTGTYGFDNMPQVIIRPSHSPHTAPAQPSANGAVGHAAGHADALHHDDDGGVGGDPAADGVDRLRGVRLVVGDDAGLHALPRAGAASNDTNQPQVVHTSTGKCTDRTCLMPGHGQPLRRVGHLLLPARQAPREPDPPVSRGLQLQSLWRIPTAAVSHRQVIAYSCNPYGESLPQL